MNKNNPLVSVILPVYNNEQYLVEAIQSILNQTHSNFEFFILSSANTNLESLAIIDSFHDKRIKHVRRAPDENLPKALNHGIEMSRGVYIARMDADDIALPLRFEQQVKFMESHPDISIAGTWAKTFGARDECIKQATEPDEIKVSLLFQTSIVHPTVIFRKSDIDKYHLRYNPDFSYSEDAEMWARCVKQVKIANIPEVLLLYRVHPEQATYVGKEKHSALREEVKKEQLISLGIMPTREELALHMMICAFEVSDLAGFLDKAERWLLRIINSNKKVNFYDQKILEKVIGYRWYALSLVVSKKFGFTVWKKFWKSSLSSFFPKTPGNIFRLCKAYIKTI